MSSEVSITLSDTYDPELLASSISTEETISLEYSNITFAPSSHQHDSSCPSSSVIFIVYQNEVIIPMHLRYHLSNERGYETIYITKPRLYLSPSSESTSLSECIIPSDTNHSYTHSDACLNQSCPSPPSLISDICIYPAILALIQTAKPYNSYNCTDNIMIRVPVGYIHHKIFVSYINTLVVYTATILIILVIAYKRR